VNIHGPHKIRHFEAAVLTRLALQKLISTSRLQGKFLGAIIGGDLNATLYRPSKNEREVSMIPWEMKIPGEFDVTQFLEDEWLEEELLKLNSDMNFKPWASIEEGLATQRITSIMDVFTTKKADLLKMDFREALYSATEAGLCSTEFLPAPGCHSPKRIDHFFVSSEFAISKSGMVQSDVTYERTDTYSDHPFLWVDFSDYRPQILVE